MKKGNWRAHRKMVKTRMKKNLAQGRAPMRRMSARELAERIEMVVQKARGDQPSAVINEDVIPSCTTKAQRVG